MSQDFTKSYMTVTFSLYDYSTPPDLPFGETYAARKLLFGCWSRLETQRTHRS